MPLTKVLSMVERHYCARIAELEDALQAAMKSSLAAGGYARLYEQEKERAEEFKKSADDFVLRCHRVEMQAGTEQCCVHSDSQKGGDPPSCVNDDELSVLRCEVEGQSKQIVVLRHQLKEASQAVEYFKEQRREMSVESQKLNAAALAFEDQLSHMREQVEALQSKIEAEQRDRRDERGMFQQRAEELRAESKQKLHEAALLQEQLGNRITELKNDLKAEAIASKQRESGLLEIIERTKLQNAASPNGLNSVVEHELMSLRQAVEEMRTRAEKAEADLEIAKRAPRCAMLTPRHTPRCTPVSPPAGAPLLGTNKLPPLVQVEQQQQGSRESTMVPKSKSSVLSSLVMDEQVAGLESQQWQSRHHAVRSNALFRFEKEERRWMKRNPSREALIALLQKQKQREGNYGSYASSKALKSTMPLEEAPSYDVDS